MMIGTPQKPGPGVPLTQHIGPQPNLPQAMRRFDPGDGAMGSVWLPIKAKEVNPE